MSDGLEVHAKEKPSRRVAAEQRRPLDEQVRATLRERLNQVIEQFDTANSGVICAEAVPRMTSR